MKYYSDRSAYRNWVEDKGLKSFQVSLGQSDLLIRSDKILQEEARRSLQQHRSAIQNYIRQHPEFGTTMEPYPPDQDSPDIIQAMVQAAYSAGVGPMAAVAGAIAQSVGRDLLDHCREIIVENGGDIFIKTDYPRRIAIFAGESIYTGKLAFELPPSDAWGVCTSSGTVGPSLSLGRADAAVVICHCAVLADAWATSLGNMVKTAQDIEPTLKFIKDKTDIKGLLLIIGDKMGLYGEIKLVKVNN